MSRSIKVNTLKNSGFSLVELLVAISILVLISAISVVSFMSYDKENRVRGARDIVMSDLQDMQSFAQIGKLSQMCVDAIKKPVKSGVKWGICAQDSDCDTASFHTCEYSLPEGGYGIRFEGGMAYKLFVDINNNKSLETNEMVVDGSKTLSGNTNFISTPTYINFNNQKVGQLYPITIIFALNNQIAFISDGGNQSGNSDIRIQEIRINNGSNSSAFFLNKKSRIIYDDKAQVQPGGSP